MAAAIFRRLVPQAEERRRSHIGAPVTGGHTRRPTAILSMAWVAGWPLINRAANTPPDGSGSRPRGLVLSDRYFDAYRARSDHVSEVATKASGQTHADLPQLWRRIYTQPQ